MDKDLYISEKVGIDFNTVPNWAYVAAVFVLYKAFEWAIEKIGDLAKDKKESQTDKYEHVVVENEKKFEQILTDIRANRTQLSNDNKAVMSQLNKIGERLVANEKDFEHAKIAINKNENRINQLDKAVTKSETEFKTILTLLKEKP